MLKINKFHRLAVLTTLGIKFLLHLQSLEPHADSQPFTGTHLNSLSRTIRAVSYRAASCRESCCGIGQLA